MSAGVRPMAVTAADGFGSVPTAASSGSCLQLLADAASVGLYWAQLGLTQRADTSDALQCALQLLS